MKISHRQLRSILRILFCLGLVFGLFVFIYELFIQHSTLYIICYICYFIVNATVLYFLFAHKRPSHRFAYGTFYGMCFVTVLFFISYIYESTTVISKMTNQLIDQIEYDKEISGPIVVMVRLSKCCLINDQRNTQNDFRIFQNKYMDTCKNIDYQSAQSCQPFIRNQRNFTILLCCFMIILRLITLYLLWKYIIDEYNNNNMNDELVSIESNDDARTSTATEVA